MTFATDSVTIRVHFVEYSKSDKPRKVNQEHFDQHFQLPEHKGIDDWRVTLINRADNRKELRRRKRFLAV